MAEAIKELGKYGYGDASVNRICEAGQISKGRLFHYYKDKDELFLTCVQACYDHLQQVQEFFRAEPEEALAQTFHRYFRLRQQHFQNHPYEALMMRVAALSSPAHLKERTDQMMDHFVEATSRVLYQILANVQPALPHTRVCLRSGQLKQGIWQRSCKEYGKETASEYKEYGLQKAMEALQKAGVRGSVPNSV